MDTEKKPYTPPQLTVYGDVRQLTATGKEGEQPDVRVPRRSAGDGSWVKDY